MISFSRTGLVIDLLKAVEELPDSTETVPEDLVKPAKFLAVTMLQGVKENRAHINLRVNVLAGLRSQQMEIQVTGRKIEPQRRGGAEG